MLIRLVVEESAARPALSRVVGGRELHTSYYPE
jgi:hypothetical protein